MMDVEVTNGVSAKAVQRCLQLSGVVDPGGGGGSEVSMVLTRVESDTSCVGRCENGVFFLRLTARRV